MKYMSRGSQWLWLYCCEPFLRSIQDCYTELYTDCTMLHQPLSDSPLCIRSHPTPPCPSVEWDYSAVNTIRKRRETQRESRYIQIIIDVKCQKFCFVFTLKQVQGTLKFVKFCHFRFVITFHAQCCFTLNIHYCLENIYIPFDLETESKRKIKLKQLYFSQFLDNWKVMPSYNTVSMN